jgi:ubiquinone/menaquinone biosynthesis C-methylase UbiE
MIMEERNLQTSYYRESAPRYDGDHVCSFDEHAFSLELMISFLNIVGATSVLDVGSGTGRAQLFLRSRAPEVAVLGIEPVSELREQGYIKGLERNELLAGDATNLNFPDNSFDVCSEFGVLHHIRDSERAVAEMCRVARRGVLISDANNWGQGSLGTRLTKMLIRQLGLWRYFDLLRTKGRGFQFSQGDGVYYSYSALDSVKILKRKFSHVHIIDTNGRSDGNARFQSSHVLIFAHNSTIAAA